MQTTSTAFSIAMSGFFPALCDHRGFYVIEAVLYTCVFAYLGADIEHIRMRIVQIGVSSVGFSVEVFKYGKVYTILLHLSIVINHFNLDTEGKGKSSGNGKEYRLSVPIMRMEHYRPYISICLM